MELPLPQNVALKYDDKENCALQRSGSTPVKGKVSALARMFAARLQTEDAQPARGDNAARVAAIRRRFSEVAKSHTAVALRLPLATRAPAEAEPLSSARRNGATATAPRLDEVGVLQAQLVKHVAEVSVLRALLAQATAAAQSAAAEPASEPASSEPAPAPPAVQEDDMAALASRLVDAEGELDAAADEIAELEEALEAAEADAEEAAAAVDAAAACAQALQRELASVRAAAESDAACAREQVEKMQASLREAAAAASASQAELAAAAQAEIALWKAAAESAEARASAAETCGRAAEQDAARVCDEAAAAKSAAAAETIAAESAQSVSAVMRDALSLAAKDVFAARTAAAQLRRRNTKLEARRTEIAASMTALMQKVGSAMAGSQAEGRQPPELLRLSTQVKLIALDAEITGSSSGSVAASDADAGVAETSSHLRASGADDADLASLQLRLWELAAENERLHGALAAALPAEQCRALRAGGSSTPMRQDKEALEEQLSVLLAGRSSANASCAAAKREADHLKQRVALLEGEHDAALAAADDYAATATRLAGRVGQLEAALAAVHACVEGDQLLGPDEAAAGCTTPTAVRKRGDAVLALALAEESGCTSDADAGEFSSPSAADLADSHMIRLCRADALLARAAATPTVVSCSGLDGGESAAESDTPCSSTAFTGAEDDTPPPWHRASALPARAAAPSMGASALYGCGSAGEESTADCEDSGITFERLPVGIDCPGSACSIISYRD